MDAGHQSCFWRTSIKISEEEHGTHRKLGQIIRSSESAVTPRSGTSEVKVKRQIDRLGQEFGPIGGTALDKQPTDTGCASVPFPPLALCNSASSASVPP